MSLGIKASMTIIEGEDRGKTFSITKERTVIGRSRGDLILADKKISSEHLCLIIEKGKLYVDDLASTNGTFVNEERVEGRTRLRNLDVLEMGFSKARITIVEDLADFRNANVPAAKISPKRDKYAKPNTSSVSRASRSKAKKVGRAKTLKSNGDKSVRGSDNIGNLIDEELKRFSRWDVAQPDSLPSFEKQLQLPKIPIELEIVEGPEKGRVIRLAKGNSVLGRGKADVKFKDNDISRNHSSIEAFSTAQIFIRDLASTNGTFVNKKKVSYSKLNHGDTIQIGSTVMRFIVKDDANKDA